MKKFILSLRFQHQLIWLWTFAKFAECQSPECDAKIRIVESVDERIDGAIHPAQPSQHAHSRFANWFAWQKRNQQIINEERQPTRNEASHDHAQRLGCFRFSLRGWNSHRHTFTITSQSIRHTLLTMHSIGLVHRMEMATHIRIGHRCLTGTEMVGLVELLYSGEFVVGDSWTGADGRCGFGDLNEFVQRFVMGFGFFDGLLMMAEDLLLGSHGVLSLWAVVATFIVGSVCVEFDFVVNRSLGCLKISLYQAVQEFKKYKNFKTND